MTPTVCGVGYIGGGKHTPSSPQYKAWTRMLFRCYGTKQQLAYRGCSVAEEWYNFQNFANWYDQNYYTVEGEVMALDKDILVRGNKVYGPETCIFVPTKLNILFIQKDNKTGLPQGVNFHKPTGKYLVKCRDSKGYRKNLGRFNTPKEAFAVYKTFKEKVIQELAEKYKAVIPAQLYQALTNFEV
jgi:hypothetical protein